MRLCTLTLAALLATTLSAAAQTPRSTPGPAPVPAPTAVAFVTSGLTANANVPQTPPEVVVARLMSFDRNHDGRITVDELSERMQGLVARGDRGGDGALDAAEIRSLAVAPTPVQVKSFGSVTSGGYGFGDEIGFSSRMHIEGAIDDLRLASDRRDEALKIATAFAEKREKEVRADLIATMTPLLSEEELKVFTLIAEQSPQFTGFRVVRAGANEKDGVQLNVLLAAMQRFQPNAKQPVEATDAIKTFRERQQLSEADRAQLLAALEDVLTLEERDDLNAALARRPVVKNARSPMAIESLSGQIKVIATELNVALRK